MSKEEDIAQKLGSRRTEGIGYNQTTISNQQMREPIELDDTNVDLTLSNNPNGDTKTFETRFMNQESRRFDHSIELKDRGDK